MLDWVYDLVSQLGYHHPLHPPATHIPVGLVIGAFLFGLAAWLFNRDSLAQTARHCIVLALLAAPIAIVLGVMDWQHFYGGAWLLPIRIKMILAVLLIFLLALAWSLSRKASKVLRRRLIVYGLCVAVVTGLGFFGGELIYGPRSDSAAIDDARVQAGVDLFAESCAMCHFTDSTETKVGPGLKGLFQREALPVSQKPVTAEAVADQLKTPFENMPAFPDLTDEEIASLVAYLRTL
jgi:uncharacterized membrane protein